MAVIWMIDIHALEFIHPTLLEVLETREKIMGAGTITSLYRINNTSSPHGTLPLRAIDERCWSIKVGDMIAKYINERWIYDYERLNMQVCIFHDTGQGPHLHYQVSENTLRRRPSTKVNATGATS